MNPQGLAKAKGRYEIARLQLQQVASAKSYNEFSNHWYLFLVAAKNVYTQVQQSAKSTPQARQWFGKKTNERKNDELLQYLFQARDDDEHGIGDVTKLEPRSIVIGSMKAGTSRHISISFATDSEGSVVYHNIHGKDGLPVHIRDTPEHAILIPVTGRGNITYNPPKSHFGKELAKTDPVSVGQTGLEYLKTLLIEAQDFLA